MQVGLLILIVTRITALDNRVTAQPATTPANPVGRYSQAPPPDAQSDNQLSSNDEARLRQIIREELRAHPATGTNSDSLITKSATPNPDNRPESSFQLDRVSQKIDYFSSVGHISEVEMGNLEMEIAKLDPVDRREMLRKLTQALNSGAIEGRF